MIIPMNLQANYEQIPLKEYAERAYLDYSMYVVLDRARTASMQMR